eukprot:6441761-Amphidinium_carterae.2
MEVCGSTNLALTRLAPKRLCQFAYEAVLCIMPFCNPTDTKNGSRRWLIASSIHSAACSRSTYWVDHNVRLMGARE